MRATLNIVFSLLLLVSQAMALVAPHFVEERGACQCCSCGSEACSPTRTPAAPGSPLAAQAQEARTEARKPEQRPVPQLSFPVSVVAVASAAVRPISLSPLVSSLPLYERFCFLLI